MVVYRLANHKYKDATLTGIGAEKVGGRWNEIGTRAVYCSENIALALLEYYVHSDNIALLPKDILVAKIEFPDEWMVNEIDDLPELWNQYPYTPSTARMFTDLAKSRDFFALKVPSAIVPLEYNIILNPLFRAFGQVEVVEFISLPIDKRLKSKNY